MVKREWKYYDFRCRDCGNVGSLGIWTEREDDFVRWDGEWTGVFGVTDRKKPIEETIGCGICSRRNVEVGKKLSGDGETAGC